MFRHLKTALDIFSTCAVAAAAVMILWRFSQPNVGQTSGRPLVEDVSSITIPSDRLANARGSGDAVLIEFSDYECPFCARHAQTTLPSLKKDFIDTGKLRHVFLNFPLSMHASAQKAGEAAECAAKQGRFWDMHDELFRAPQALDLASLEGHATRLGLNTSLFAKCLGDGQTADKVRFDQTEGRRLGVNGTPSFFVGLIQTNGSVKVLKRINGLAGPEDFSKTLEDVISQIDKTE